VLTKNAVGANFRHGSSHGEQGGEGEKELHLDDVAMQMSR
jgi:hypothetical protein